MRVREYAWKILDRIVNHGAYASLLMRQTPASFSPSDQALVSEIVYGTLRNLRYLEYQWIDLVHRVDDATRVLLCMSVYQLQYMSGVPDYAVIHDAVDLAERERKSFVNALLRNVQRRGIRKAAIDDPLLKCALETSHPDWLLKMWAAHYGVETAMAIAQKDQERAIVYGRCNTLRMSMNQLATDPAVHRVENDCFTYEGILSRTSLFQQGAVLIQDRASQRIPHLLRVSEGMRVLDACAAPGTKTQQIACLMNDQGSIDALDIHAERVDLIKALMKRTGVSIVRAFCADAATYRCEGRYDRILVDAPCSGLGDLSHKPEIRLHVKPADLDALCRLQAAILDCQCENLKPGGVLVYSTCTLNKKENERQIAAFLKRRPDFSLLAQQTWFPQALQSDGFYGAALLKKA